MQVVFLVLDVYGLGGTVRTVVNTANHLAARGDVDVQVLSVFRTAEQPLFPLDPRVRVTALHDVHVRASGAPQGGTATLGLAGRLRHRAAAWLTTTRLRLFHRDEDAFQQLNLVIDLKVVRAVRRIRGGVLVSTRPGFNLLCARLRRPEVVLVGQEHTHHDAHRPGLQHAIERWYPRLDALSVLTAADERRYREVLDDSVPIIRIPNALPRLDPVEADLTTRTFVAAGRFAPEKGFDLLVAAFGLVAAKHPDWQLRIYGRGPQEAALRAQVAKAGLVDHVLFPGPTARLEHEMAEASGFVLSSRYEGFGLVLVEAMHVGLPVVSFACPHGPVEIIRHGETGVLVPAGDVPALAEAMNRLIEHPEERRRLGRAGRHAVRQFDAEDIGETWYRTLKGLTASPHG